MFNLYTTHEEYVQSSLTRLAKERKQAKSIFLILNIISALMILFTAVLTPLMISHLLYIDSYPDWFFYATAGASAVGGFVTSLLNFFVIKEKITTSEEMINLIESELVLFYNKATPSYKGKNAEFNLYVAVGSILGSKAAKQEVSNG